MVVDCPLIELSVVLYWVQFAILFLYEEKWCCIEAFDGQMYPFACCS